MATEPVTIRIPKEDVKYIEEYAERLGMKKTPFLQNLVAEQLAVLRKEPMPEKVRKKERPAPSPKDTAFWRRYKEAMK